MWCLEDGKLYSWGSGMYGKLGHCDTVDQLSPHPIFFTEKLVFVKVAASSTHTLALTSNLVSFFLFLFLLLSLSLSLSQSSPCCLCVRMELIVNELRLWCCVFVGS
jgi:hypothetical protein